MLLIANKCKEVSNSLNLVEQKIDVTDQDLLNSVNNDERLWKRIKSTKLKYISIWGYVSRRNKKITTEILKIEASLRVSNQT